MASTGSEEEGTPRRDTEGYPHFHKLRWRTVIERVFGHECVYLAARIKLESLSASRPLVRVRSVVFGHYLVSMPFVNSGGPVGTETAVRASSISGRGRSSRSGQVARKRSSVPIDTHPALSHRKITVVLDLPATPEQLLRASVLAAQPDSSPQKEGVTVALAVASWSRFFSYSSAHARPGDANPVADILSRNREPVSGDCWMAALISRPTVLRGQAWGVPFGERIRDDLGHRFASTTAGSEHAGLLDVHGTCDRRGVKRFKLRALHARCWHAPVQDAVGWPRRAVCGGMDSLLPNGVTTPHPGTALSDGGPGSGGASGIDRHQSWALDRALHPVNCGANPRYFTGLLQALLDGLGAAMGFDATAHAAVSSALNRRYGSRAALLTNSGTSALILAFAEWYRPGGTVAYPAYGCIDLTTAAIGAGVRVRLYNSIPHRESRSRFCARSDQRGVDAIVVAHLYGSQPM